LTLGEKHSEEDDKALAHDQAELIALKQHLSTQDASTIQRIWGPWDQVHPASGGVESQTGFFLRSAFDPSRDHPASYGLHDEKEDDLSLLHDSLSSGSSASKLPEGAELQKLSMKTLTALPGANKKKPGQFDVHENDPNSAWLIADSPHELALMEVRRCKGKICLLALTDPLIVFSEKDLHLNSRQSRAHRFELPDRDDARVLEITVTIVFQGNFANKGYKLGRLAAGLFRLPDEKDKSGHASAIPEPVGYAPYSMQSPNLPEALGRCVILHRPKHKPIKPGAFQIVIGVASSTKYSIEVNCKVAQTALPVVDGLIVKAKTLQVRLPNILMELDDMQESLRLAERKLLVCKKLINEAKMESEKSQRSMAIVSHKLEVDDEEMTMMEDERKQHERELGILEIEYAQWTELFATRNQEEDDIKEGIKMIFEVQRSRQQEKKKIKAELEKARHDLPACLAALRGILEATNVAAALNTSVQGASSAWAASFMGENMSTGQQILLFILKTLYPFFLPPFLFYYFQNRILIMLNEL